MKLHQRPWALLKAIVQTLQEIFEQCDSHCSKANLTKDYSVVKTSDRLAFLRGIFISTLIFFALTTPSNILQ